MKWIIDNKEFFTLLLTLIGLVFGYFKFLDELKENKNQFKELSEQNLKDRISSTTSTFRQNWVQEFRGDISQYYSLINEIGLLIDYKEEHLTNISKKEYDLLLRLNVNSAVDKKIESDLMRIRKLYVSLFRLINFKNFDVCDDIIYEHKYTILNDEKDKAHSLMSEMIFLDSALYDNTSTDIESAERAKKNYKDSIELLVRKTRELLLVDLKKVKNKLFFKFRIYLKVEWERIKQEIENGINNFDFDDMYNSLVEKNTQD